MKEFNRIITAVQSEIRAPKNKKNDFAGYCYRSAEDILETAKPVLAKYGLTLSLSDDIIYIGNRYYVKATATLSDGENTFTTSAFARETESRKGMDDAQVTGTASSYARKYALNGLFCLDDNKDVDSMDNRVLNEPTYQPYHPDSINRHMDPQMNNTAILRTFCTNKKTEEGVNLDQLKRFFNYWNGKIERGEFKGQIDPERLWSSELRRA